MDLKRTITNILLIILSPSLLLSVTPDMALTVYEKKIVCDTPSLFCSVECVLLKAYI